LSKEYYQKNKLRKNFKPEIDMVSLDHYELSRIILKKTRQIDQLKATLIAHRLYDAIEELDE